MEHNNEMIIDHVQRLQKVEDTVESHSKQLADFGKIASDVRAIKWISLGVSITVVVQQFGLVETAKALLGIGH